MINSGNANAFTSKQGITDAETCINHVSSLLNIKPEECYIGSTGVIGQKLEMKTIIPNLDKLVNKLESFEENSKNYVEATMTTDTYIKQASIKFNINNEEVSIGASVKGSGMIMPDMATMLGTVLTDIKISPRLLSKALSEAVTDSFNCITV